ncbi:TPR-like protein [Ceraceosorus guamensis]|uniref:TPR-like protein n=1 Tax=Ceraceosorus guamensis TaxID=1522189 RepID=A0A316VS21_9BASI|nr:TPR-like protein [Ceraceosorus guamensis]PWN39848.1 TPR-like protein [Ceraceosorus guamensis]
MSSSFAKSKLKASRDAIQAKRWSEALESADAVLEHEVDNYNALVFKGLALLNLERYDESEHAYRAAARAQPDSPLAWQGLEKFFQQRKNAAGIQECLEEEMRVFSQAGDAGKLAEAIQRLVALQREEGSSAQVAAALELYLETSPHHALLATLPQPDQSSPTATSTYEAQLAMHQKSLDVLLEVISLTEAVEEAAVGREVEKRRTRLDSAGKTRAALRDEVGAEVWANSKLPAFFELVLAHASAPDEIRRQAELKLLQHRYKLLLSLPNPRSRPDAPTGTAATDGKAKALDAQKSERKDEAREQVLQLAHGMVAIGVAEELAWEIDLEWADYARLEDLPRDHLRAFIEKFPRASRTLAFRGLLTALQDEQYLEDEADIAKRNDVEQATPDLLALAIHALEDAPQSILVHRIASTMYLLDRDYLSASDVCSAGLALVSKLEAAAALDLSSIRRSLESTLAAALSRLHPPQHHARALRLLDGVLAGDAENADAMIAKAFIDETALRWDDAKELYGQVEAIARKAPEVSPLSFSSHPGIEAKGGMAWCDVRAGRFNDGRQALDGLLNTIDGDDGSLQLSSEERAQAWWRLGYCLWQMGGEQKTDPENAFTCFVTALKRSPGYAPAFTSLGFYYEEVASDAGRAAKCFQKAFELDAREDVAARQLAVGFANDREWDLVDVVARRVVEGEGGSDALGGAMASLRKHISRNAWAWKAVGSVELQRRHFDKAIEALHVALRTQPADASAWQRLGEAYAGSERYSAALKAFHKAQELSPDEWAVRYSIAEVHRDVGEMYEALAIFNDISKHHPEEIGVTIAAAETSLLLAKQQMAGGYVLRAQQSLQDALAHCLIALSDEPRLRSGWSIAADSVLELSRVASDGRIRESQVSQLLSLLEICNDEPVDAGLPSVSVCQRHEVRSGSANPQFCAKASVFLHKLRVVSAAPDEQADAWSSLAVALQHLDLRAHVDGANEQATACIKQALRLQPESSRFWMILGNLSFLSDVTVAQHSFLRAIEAAPQDALPWCYLGLLYLQHDDVELANQALIKAQTLDPDLPQAWAGQAYIALRHGDEAASRVLFAHAVNLSESSCLEADYGFASGVYKLLCSATPPPKTQLHAPAFSLSVLLAFSPHDSTALHLSALFCEQLGEFELAIERITRAASLLESDYEADEKPLTATKYAIAQANLGRIRLAIGDADGAVDALEAALGLFDVGADDAASGEMMDGKKRIAVRVAAHLGLALAHHLLEDDEVEAALQSALEEISSLDDEDFKSRLRAQISIERVRLLPARSESYESATAELLDCVTSMPNDLNVLSTLAAIGVADEDHGLIDAATSEIASMDSSTRSEDIDLLLALIDFGHGQERTDTALSRLRNVADQTPSSVEAHLTYAEALLRAATSTNSKRRAEEAYAAAQKAFGVVNSTEGGEENYARSMRLLALAASFSNADAPVVNPAEEAGTASESQPQAAAPPDLGQRALHAAPWDCKNWRTAAFVRAKESKE